MGSALGVNNGEGIALVFPNLEGEREGKSSIANIG